MRSIVVAHLDKARPALLLTAPARQPHLRRLTLAPITSTVRGLSSEVAVGQRNGLDHDSVVSCDNLITVAAHAVGGTIGIFFDDQEADLARALADAFDLQPFR